MRTIIGERIYVETTMFDGWATVVGIADDPRDQYPIFIELEEGDEDGHTYKRIDNKDIKHGPRT